jgi:hypothetical protein
MKKMEATIVITAVMIAGLSSQRKRQKVDDEHRD